MKYLSIFSVITLIIFATYPQIDLYVSGLFYDEVTNNFPLRNVLISQVLYYSVRFVTIASFFVCVFIFTYDASHKPVKFLYSKILPSLSAKIRNLIKITSREAVYFASVIIITPGILVHWVLKPLWDRARPVNVEEFGGVNEYTNFYHLMAGQGGNSFPSGHASMAFAVVALAFLVKPERRNATFIATFIYGILASMCRVWQGGHYLSDVTFSAIITLWTVFLCRKFILKNA